MVNIAYYLFIFKLQYKLSNKYKIENVSEFKFNHCTFSLATRQYIIYIHVHQVN